jgi:hypothetical protein
MPEIDVPKTRPGREARAGADQFVLRDLVEHEAKPAARPARRPRSRLALGGVLLGTAALATAGFTYAAVNSGPEYVDRLPDDATAMQHGEIDGVEYWLVPNRPPGICEADPRPGVALVSEAHNKVGEEWKTFVIDYGDTVQNPRPGTPPGMVHICDERIDDSAWLADPSRWERFDTRLTDGGRPVIMTAVHPGVTSIVIVAPDGTRTKTPTVARPDRPDGPRYALAPLPTGAGRAVQVELRRADGFVVATHTVPRPTP